VPVATAALPFNRAFIRAANRETGKRKAAELARRLQVARSHIRPCVLFNFLSACFRVNTVLMKRQTVITKKRRGPAPTGKGTLVGVRLQPDRLSAVDAWIARQTAPMTRPEAIRAMLDAVLVIVSNHPSEKPKARKQAARASEMAAQTIERKLDPAVPEEERAQRRRRLTKGPPEFREDRVDLPKAKTK